MGAQEQRVGMQCQHKKFFKRGCDCRGNVGYCGYCGGSSQGVGMGEAEVEGLEWEKL